MNQDVCIFVPKIKTLGQFEPDKVFTFRDFKDETMFFSCDPDFIYANSQNAPLTVAILNKVLSCTSGVLPCPSNLNIVIDTRVNMLMPGQYPSIPGWHCDDVPREQTDDGFVDKGQPDFFKMTKDVQHFMVLVSDTPDPATCISGTEFVTNKTIYNLNPSKVWQSLHETVEADTQKKTSFVRERDITQFNQDAIHRASPATRNGWRLFFRMSYTHRKPANEIRRQVQTYVDPNNAGW